MSNLVKGYKRTQLTLSIQRSAKTNENQLHVIPYKGKWGVKWEGSDRFYRVFATRTSAIKLAEVQAKLKGSSAVIVHDKDGMIFSTAIYT